MMKYDTIIFFEKKKFQNYIVKIESIILYRKQLNGHPYGWEKTLKWGDFWLIRTKIDFFSYAILQSSNES